MSEDGALMTDGTGEIDLFVNRHEYVNSFRTDVLSRGRQALFLYGDDGRGKTALLKRLAEVAKEDGAAVAHVSCEDDPIRLMWEVERQLKLDAFEDFKERLRQFYSPKHSISLDDSLGRQISVANQANLAHAAFRDIIGSQITINDPVFLSEGSKSRWSFIVSELGGIFTETLHKVSAEHRIVIFLDHVEKAVEDTRNWVWHELVGPLREGALGQVLLVVTVGKERPRLEWRAARSALVRAVRDLTEEHMIDYVVGRIRTIERQEAKWIVLVATAKDKGNMHLLASAVDAVVQRLELDGGIGAGHRH